MERNFKGIWIPKEIWLAENLTIQEKVLLVEIDSLDDEETGCYASNTYFSKFFSLTTQRVSQIINTLATKGFISIEFVYQGKEIDKRIIKINRPPYPNIEVSNIFDRYQENLQKGIKYSLEGYQENFKENNTNINNINNNKKKFTKPSLEELQNFIKENNLNVDANDFIDYYNSNGWKVGRNSMKDWKATCRRWSRTNKEPKKDIKRPEWFDKEIKKEEFVITDEIKRKYGLMD